MRSCTAPERAAPGGTGYEAKEGARGGEAVRKANCQCPASSGGAVAGNARPTREDLRTSINGKAESNNGTPIGAMTSN